MNISKPFLIAEIGINHNGNMNITKELITNAKKCGFDAVKFQTFKAENFVTKRADMAKYQKKNTQKKDTNCF